MCLVSTRSPVRAAMAAARASRSSPISTRPTPDRPPRHRHECRGRRRVHGPAGTLVWEDVLAGEVGGRPLQDLDLHLELALFTAQLGEFLLLLAGQLRGVGAGGRGTGASRRSSAVTPRRDSRIRAASTSAVLGLCRSSGSLLITATAP